MAVVTVQKVESSSDDGDVSYSRPSESHLEPLIFPPKREHTHTFILLHGRGGAGNSFGPEFLVAETSCGKPLQELLPGMKFVFPTAKRRRMARSNRCTINQWFDLFSLDDTCFRNELQVEGLRESSSFIHKIIQDEMELIPCSNIIIGGLSQGCATALYVLLTFQPPPPRNMEESISLGAMIGMSGWLPFCKAIIEVAENLSLPVGQGDIFALDGVAGSESNPRKEIQALNFLRDNIDLPPLAISCPAALKTPVFLGHGTADEKVKIDHGQDAAAALEMLRMDVTWVAYQDFYHWYKEPDEIDDIVAFLRKKLGFESNYV